MNYESSDYDKTYLMSRFKDFKNIFSFRMIAAAISACKLIMLTTMLTLLLSYHTVHTLDLDPVQISSGTQFEIMFVVKTMPF